MKITDSTFIKGYTSLALSESIPLKRWGKMLIDGEEYTPIPIMDAGNECIAIMGNHDLTGKEVQFV